MTSQRKKVKKPEYRDFGITEREYQKFLRAQQPPEKLDDDLLDDWASRIVFIVFWISGPITNSVVTGDARNLAWLLIAWVPAMIGTVLFQFIVRDSLQPMFRRWKVRRSSKYSRIEEFYIAQAYYVMAQTEAELARQRSERVARQAQRRAEEARHRKSMDHWTSLRDIEFENELATLYQQLGFAVENTPRTGDQGIDLVLHKGRKTTIVQCKGQAKPASPGVVRDLFGALIASGADDAVLACPVGFTSGVYKFVKGKPIKLVSAPELVIMAENAQPGRTRPTQSKYVDAPVCPVKGCGANMRHRKGRFGEFWGCSKYPTCRGTRRIR